MERLDGRQRWLMLAIAALDEGRIDQVREVSAAARAEGQLDVAEVLDLLLLEPSRIDPTAVRRDAKARGAGNQARQLPFLDLLRAAAVFRRDDRPQRRPSLNTVMTEGAPLQRRLVRLLTTDAVPSPVIDDEPTPRAAQIMAATLLFVMEDHVCEGCMRQVVDGDLAIDFSARKWPELGGDISGWAASTRAFHLHDIHALEDALHGSHVQARAALGAVLSRVGRDVASGRLDGVAMACGTSIALADRIDPHLTRDMDRLMLRLAWWDPQGRKVPALTALWRERAALSPAEQVVLCRAILEHRGEVEGDLPVHEAAAIVVAGGTDEETRLVLEELGQELRVSQLSPLLRDVAPLRAHWVMGSVRARQGAVKQALAEAGALATLPRGAALACEVVGTLRRGQRKPLPDKLEHPVLEALASATLTVEDYANLLAKRFGDLPPALARAVEAALERPSGSIDALGAGGIVACAIGQQERAGPWVRAIGRQLRKLEGDDADQTALRVTATLLIRDTRTAAVVGPLLAYIQHLGPERVRVAVGALDRDERVLAGLTLCAALLEGELREVVMIAAAMHAVSAVGVPGGYDYRDFADEGW